MTTWLIIEMNTGAQDGFYAHREDAELVRENHRERHPGGRWIIAGVDHDMNQGARIPEHMFWLRRIGISTAPTEEGAV